jgi:PmbA protein
MNGRASAVSLLDRLAGRVDGAEVYEVHSHTSPVRFAFSALQSVRSVETAGRSLRVIKEGRLGFSATTDLTDTETVVRNALDSAQFGDPAPFRFPSPQPSPPVLRFDRQVQDLDESALIALGEEIIAEILAFDPHLQVDVGIDRAVVDLHLVNSSGLEFRDWQTSFAISVSCARVSEGDILMLYGTVSSCRKSDVDGLALARRLVERLRWATRTAVVRSQAMPVVFHLDGTLALLLPLMSGLSGREVYLRASPLAQRLGQEAFDPRLTLIDDGRLDFALRSAAYDDEGTPTARKVLIDKGIARQFIYDLKTAGQAGAQSTGNGFRAGGFRGLPDVTPSTWSVLPGNDSLQRILDGLDEALLVEAAIGVGQGNVRAGEFSTNVGAGFLVRRGEVVGRVKNTMIAGNAYELLKERLLALGDQAEWVHGSLLVPAVAVDGVGVASQG